MRIKFECFLLFVCFSIVLAKEMNFCDEFLKENHIDYGYQHQTNEYYLFINTYYWRLDINERTVTFESLLTKRSNDRFTKDFSFAISAKVCEDLKCVNSSQWLTGLYQQNDMSLQWIKLEENSDNFDILVKNISAPDKTILGLDIQPMIGFLSKNDFIECFLQQKSDTNQSKEYIRKYRCVSFYLSPPPDDYSNGVIKAIKALMDVYNRQPIDKSVSVVNEGVLNDIKDNREVIAIFQINNNYLFLHKEDTTITYCFTEDKQPFYKGCSKGDVKTLINCSKEVVEPIPQSSKLPDTSSSNIETVDELPITPLEDESKVKRSSTGKNSLLFWLIALLLMFVVIGIVLIGLFRFILVTPKAQTQPKES